MPDLQKIADDIAAFLETRDGRKAGNETIRRTLRLGMSTYWRAHGVLIASGRAMRGQGRGGSLRLVGPRSPVVEAPPGKGEGLVDVDVQRLAALLAGTAPLALDDYQRPYVWPKERVQQLVEDLRVHALSAPPGVDYYMGSILLHEDRERGRRYIVDGQQRLTSLCLLHHRAHGDLPAGQALTFRSRESVENLRRARQGLDDVLIDPELLQRVCFTVITVRAVDLAFTFFDTQNNRGVALGATDLLKAYHLRGVAGAGAADLQRRCARLWEGVQRHPEGTSGSEDAAARLFEKVLWRGRRWTGQRALVRESQDEILKEFEQRSLPTPSASSVPVYPSPHLARRASLSLDASDRYVVTVSPEREGTDPADLPFALRQPIHRGLGFFLYTVKYAHLQRRLLHEHTTNREIRELRRIDALHEDANLSPYLREVFRLGVVLYADRFETARLFEFGLWLDHVLGAIRLSKHYVFKEAATNLLADARMNLLDVVASAFRPEEVIEFLRAETWANAPYEQDPGDDQLVRGRYAKAVLRFYGREGSLGGKQLWIDAAARGVST